MAHLAEFLPGKVELGAVRHEDWSVDIVKMDGGGSVRNSRWSAPLREFEISFPTSTREDETYQAVKALYRKAQGSTHTFNFRDWSEGGEVVRVRFDGKLTLTGIDRRFDHIETITLVEEPE